jgi:ABC-type spermidine/putrescine transport systems, ATPase components
VRITLDSIIKRYGEHCAVNKVSLDIGDGEFFTLLGPSGCGKTTLLRMLAGFNYPNSGDILFDGNSIVKTPPHLRETGMVFQNYALFPHLTVSENINYGLKARKMPADQIKKRVGDILSVVELDGLERRYPKELSGGQQQRVALARALVIRPRVLLMDEPLSNLDAQLRVNMRDEIRRIQLRLGITTIYVTHDQEEAMAISDRIAVLSRGTVQQVDTPWNIYYQPANRFIADFMGACTLLSFKAGRRDGNRTYGTISDQHFALADKSVPPAEEALLMLRPDCIDIAARGESAATENTFPGIVLEGCFLGSYVSYQVEALGMRMRVDVGNSRFHRLIPKGTEVLLSFTPDAPVVVQQ